MAAATKTRLGIARRISVIAFRHWAAQGGYSGRNLGRVIAGICAVAACGSAGLALLLWAKLPAIPPVPAYRGLTTTISSLVFEGVMLGTSLMVVVAASATGDEDRLTVVLRPLPISNRWLALSLSLPILAVAASAGLLAVPPLVAALGRLAGAQPAVAAVAVAAMAAWGGSVGLLALSLSRLLLGRVPGTKQLVYPGAVVAWVFYAGMNALLVQRLGLETKPALSADGLASMLAGWPVAADATRHPRLAAWLLLAAILAALAALAWLTHIRSVPVGVDIRAIPTVRWRWSHRWVAPIVRLELHRLLRTPRIRASWAAAALLTTAGLGWVALTSPDSQSAIGSFVVLPIVVAVANLAYIARGFSPRVQPNQLVIGLRPHRWAWALTLAALILAATLAAPIVLVLGLVTSSLPVAVFVLGLEIQVLSASAALGFVTLPGPANKGAEAAGMVVTGFSAAGALFAVGQLVRDLRLVGLLLAMGSCLLLVPGIVETGRWRALVPGRDTGLFARWR